MDLGNHSGAFANSRRHPFDRTTPRIADRENARTARLEWQL
jgi:hypothetical protein